MDLYLTLPPLAGFVKYSSSFALGRLFYKKMVIKHLTTDEYLNILSFVLAPATRPYILQRRLQAEANSFVCDSHKYILF